MRKKTRAVAAVVSLVFAVVVLFAAGAASAASGAPRIAPPNSSAFGKTFPEWLAVYWRWYYGTAQDPAQSLVGHVLLMPIPNEEYVSGAGSPEDPAVVHGDIAVTVAPGTVFVLPLIGLVGERYEGYPGVPDDPISLADGAIMLANFTIDGRTIVSSANSDSFLVKATPLNPIVVYPEPTGYGSIGAVWFQSIGIVSPPLPVGVHQMHLDGTLIVAPYFGTIFDNSWTVTVAPH